MDASRDRVVDTPSVRTLLPELRAIAGISCLVI
jgi:hypothetical protein